MKISKIKIENFKSIKKLEIEFTDLNILIGQNNHGKTNFLDAIEWFYNGSGNIENIKHKRSEDNEVFIEITFTEIQEGLEKMKNEKNKTTLADIFKEKTECTIKMTNISPEDKNKLEKPKRFLLLDDNTYKKNPTGFDTSLNDFLPKLEYVSTEIKPSDKFKYGKNSPIANMLSGVLTTILSKDPNYKNFEESFEKLFIDENSNIRKELDKLSGSVKEYLKKQFSETEEVIFNVLEPAIEDLLKNFETKIDDGVVTEAEEKGDGMQRALMLAIIQAYSDFRKKNEESVKNFIFLIDEGELHLHPTAQRKLKNVLKDLTKKGDQVFLTTHSSVLVTDNSDEEKIYEVKKENKDTNIRIITEYEKQDVIFDLLGGSPSDLLLPKNFIIVEGKSDYEFIKKIIDRFYKIHFKNIKIIFSGGDIVKQEGSLNAIDSMLRTITGIDGTPIYKDKVVILIDKPNSDQQHNYDSFKNGYSYIFEDNRVFELDECSIEQYYPDDFKKSKEEINVKDFNKVAYAKEVAEKIDKNIFEQKMDKIFKTLEKAKEKSF